MYAIIMTTKKYQNEAASFPPFESYPRLEPSEALGLINKKYSTDNFQADKHNTARILSIIEH